MALRAVFEHGGEWHTLKSLWRFLAGFCNARFRLGRMCGRERGPVVVVDIGEVGGDLLVVEN